MVEDLTLSLLGAGWERVRDNDGGPGVDGVTVEAYDAHAATLLPELLAQAQRGEYLPLPLRKIVVEKQPGTGLGRTLLVPCVRDRILQTAMARLLSRSFEEEFLEISYAYRAGRGVDRAVARILQLRDRGWTDVVDADITSYFDEISHKLMQERLRGDPAVDPATLDILKSWIKAEVWDGHRLTPLRRGIPQGSPISPLMANYFLTPLDEALAAGGHKLIRYADDFLILCKSREGAEGALAATAGVLRGLGLRLNMSKTRLTSFAEGFRFLGVRFAGQEAMIPWKPHRKQGRVLFIARAMPPRALREYRKVHGVRPAGPAGPERPPGAGAGKVTTRAGAAEVDMPYLYVTLQGAILRKSGDRFLLEHDGEIVMDLPYHRLEHILVFGNVQITSQAMAEALDHNIALSLFSRQGRYRGSLSPPPGKNVLLRLQQYGIRQDVGAALGVARETIRWKLENCLRVLERYEDRDRQADETQEARQAITGIQAGLDEADSVPEIQGREGAAARLYFDGVMRFNRSGLEWRGREKHPARDPLNALLSLAYTLVMQELSALVEAHGLDPAIGFLHEVDGARPSLALDLMEPFRAPIADRFVLTTVNRGQIQAEDFEKRDDHGGLFLKPEAMRGFFEAWERWMLTPVAREGEKPVHFRDLLRQEVANFAAMLRTGSKWDPYGFGPLRELKEGEA